MCIEPLYCNQHLYWSSFSNQARLTGKQQKSFKFSDSVDASGPLNFSISVSVTILDSFSVNVAKNQLRPKTAIHVLPHRMCFMLLITSCTSSDVLLIEVIWVCYCVYFCN